MLAQPGREEEGEEEKKEEEEEEDWEGMGRRWAGAQDNSICLLVPAYMPKWGWEPASPSPQAGQAWQLQGIRPDTA